MAKRFFVIFSVIAAFPALAHAQLSDASCDDRAGMAQTLTEGLGAEKHGSGLRNPETLLEVWVKARNGDWVSAQSYANGTACIVAMGEDWQHNLRGTP